MVRGVTPLAQVRPPHVADRALRFEAPADRLGVDDLDEPAAGGACGGHACTLRYGREVERRRAPTTPPGRSDCAATAGRFEAKQPGENTEIRH
jgi:hypothetical protein